MLQDFSAGYYLLDAEVFCGHYDSPSMYVDSVYEIREEVGVDVLVGKLGSSHFEIMPSGALPDGALVLPEHVFETTEADVGEARVLIAKERALDVLDRAGLLS